MPITLGGRYRLDDLIGGGGMGEVWRAHDEVLDRAVAIKVIRPHLADDEHIRARLRVEAKLAGSLHHPGIVDVFDYGEDTESGRAVPFIVMPLIDGVSLSALLADRTTLSAPETMSIVSAVAAALQSAHDAGIVHRDLKPGNILLTPNRRVLLVDFGIAHSAQGEPLTQTGSLIGTADFLSPEQASGRRATSASDLYSLGVVAFVCLTGTLPFHRESDVATALAHLQADLPDLPDTVPAATAALVRSLLAKNPSERPASAAEAASRAAALAGPVPLPPGDAEELDRGPTVPDATPDAHTSVVAAAHARDSRAPRRIALMSSILLVGAAAGISWLLMDGDDTVAVPRLEGRSISAATRLVKAEGLTLKTRRVSVAGHPAGEVVNQSPDPGVEVGEEATVAVTVATGRIAIPVDQLVGTTYDTAAARLVKLGLKPRRVEITSSKVAGTVIAVDPDDPVKPGTTISLSVAQAPVAATTQDTTTGPGAKDPRTPRTTGPGKAKVKARDKAKGGGKPKK
jgi:eukaryotic-like serine/threonine-protein kinase